MSRRLPQFSALCMAETSRAADCGCTLRGLLVALGR